MDANGVRFWMLADERHWRTGRATDYDPLRRRLRLRSTRGRLLPPGANDPVAEAESRAALEIVPSARDGFGAFAYWNTALGVVAVRSTLPGEVVAFDPPGTSVPTDLAVGSDGVLYIALDGSIVMHDLRGRWDDVVVQLAGFTAWRLAPDPNGGAYVLDRTAQRVAHVHGSPFPRRPYAPYDACTVRPCEENPDAPRLAVLERAEWLGEAVALDCAPDGRLALLVWRAGEEARVYLQQADGSLGPAIRLRGIQFPHTVAWTSAHALATRITRLPTEALVFDVADAFEATAHFANRGLHAVGDVYPMRAAAEGRFVHTPDAPAHYPAPHGSAPLLPLSAPAYPERGTAKGRRSFDSRSTSTVWHRLYLEAVLPPGCGVRVCLAATDEPVKPTAPEDWHEHLFGEIPRGNGRSVPRGAWLPEASEIAFSAGFLNCERVPRRIGLFTALVQRSNRRVRALQGRHLWVVVELFGNGRATPEIAALRVYASRFSYAQRYLPELYHEQLYGRERDDVVPADVWPPTTRADFLERFLANTEGVLTVLEDRIASAFVLTDPRTTPSASLEWLASWIGVVLDPALSAARQRQLLRAAPYLYRRRGTLAGLRAALDLVTGGDVHEDGRIGGGGVSGGEIVVVENWRLRRTFATILGADLADEDDPLLGGLAVSGNSYVGDTLFLGEERRKEFLALFSDDVPRDAAEEAAVAAFFEALAWRVTILVHDDVEPHDLGLIRRVAVQEAPAHVETRVVPAPAPLLVGIASLVGVDTYLRAPVPRQAVRTNRSRLGRGDVLLGTDTLDPRLGSSPATRLMSVRPTAVLDGPASVDEGETFTLDGSRSRAATARMLTDFHWTLLR